MFWIRSSSLSITHRSPTLALALLTSALFALLAQQKFALSNAFETFLLLAVGLAVLSRLRSEHVIRSLWASEAVRPEGTKLHGE